MKPRKIPMRSCIVTREKYPKQELLRIVRQDGQVLVDPTGKMNGKGAYIKKDLEVLKKAQKQHSLDRALEVTVPEEIYQEIEAYITKDAK